MFDYDEDFLDKIVFSTAITVGVFGTVLLLAALVAAIINAPLVTIGVLSLFGGVFTLVWKYVDVQV